MKLSHFHYNLFFFFFELTIYKYLFLKKINEYINEYKNKHSNVNENKQQNKQENNIQIGQYEIINECL